jgi:hypothetical protein
VREFKNGVLQRVVRSSGWSLRVSGRIAASEVVIESPEGREVRRVRLVGVDPTTSDEVRAASALPRSGAVDVLRGQSGVLQVVDARGKELVLHAATPRGMVDIPVPDDESRRGRRLQYFGWGIGAGVVLLLVGVVWRAHRGARAASAAPTRPRSKGA